MVALVPARAQLAAAGEAARVIAGGEGEVGGGVVRGDGDGVGGGEGCEGKGEEREETHRGQEISGG